MWSWGRCWKGHTRPSPPSSGHIPQRRRPFGIFSTRAVVVVVVVLIVIVIVVVVVVVIIIIIVVVIVVVVIVVVIIVVLVVIIDSNSGNFVDSGEGNTRTSHNKEQTVSGKGEKRIQKRMMEAAMLMQSQEYM
jgi:hypothetical protein